MDQLEQNNLDQSERNYSDHERKRQNRGDYSNGSIISLAFETSPFLTKKPNLKSLRGKIKNLKKLDFSMNGLHDVDAPFIAELVNECRPEVIDISINRIHGCDLRAEDVEKAILNIISNTSKYVNIVRNPFSSIDKKDFFTRLEEEQLKKLIWIPAPWISVGRWKNLIPNHNLHATVEKTHEDYYNNL